MWKPLWSSEFYVHISENTQNSTESTLSTTKNISSRYDPLKPLSRETTDLYTPSEQKECKKHSQTRSTS